ncbi:MAG: plastocyanin/azurin family copper-binding protein [Spirochaetaceae bacterium]|nr:plastocyanin/azurin family copper-binding protein [Spirochaetaceae bacterium]MDT8297583.1 plastocyanin/azurin family copper-binding protein [Spirochaetaceae bacterium]
MALIIAGSLSAGEVLDYSDVTDGVVDIAVSNQGLRFTVDEIVVRIGANVRLTFDVVGGMHDWVLDEFDAATEVMRRGGSQTIEFTADEAGTFEYYCSVTGHRRSGMYGSFIVIE